MGIDYGMRLANVSSEIDPKTGKPIRYGVINQNEVLQAWADSSEPDYGTPCCPKCGTELSPDIDDGHICDCGNVIDLVGEECYGEEPLGWYLDDGEYQATSDSYGDIFITKSPYYTRCGFCSSCAPGAGYLTDGGDDCAAYCFGSDWFDDDYQACPYPIYRVSDGQLIYTPTTK